MKVQKYGRYVRINDTTWPYHIEKDEDSVQWRLRYGNPTREDLLFAASVMSAYQAIIELPISKRAVIMKAIRGVK